jgi:hypothetical protein
VSLCFRKEVIHSRLLPLVKGQLFSLHEAHTQNGDGQTARSQVSRFGYDRHNANYPERSALDQEKLFIAALPMASQSLGAPHQMTAIQAR